MWLVGGRLYDVASGAFRFADLRVEDGGLLFCDMADSQDS